MATSTAGVGRSTVQLTHRTAVKSAESNLTNVVIFGPVLLLSSPTYSRHIVH